MMCQTIQANLGQPPFLSKTCPVMQGGGLGEGGAEHRQTRFLAVGTAVVGQVLAVMKRLEAGRGAGGSELMGGGGITPRAWAKDAEEKRGGGGLGPKSMCTQNGPTRFSRWYISFLPTVTLVGGGGGQGGTVSSGGQRF